MNDNVTQKDLGKGYIYATGARATQTISDNKQDLPVPPLDPRNIYRLVPSNNNLKKESKTIYRAVRMMTQEYVMTEDPKVMTQRVASAINIDDEAQNYLKTELP